MLMSQAIATRKTILKGHFQILGFYIKIYTQSTEVTSEVLQARRTVNGCGLPRIS